MNFFKDGRMTHAAQKLDEIMAAEDRYWDAQQHEYGHSEQDTPGKRLVVHFLSPLEVQIEPVMPYSTEQPRQEMNIAS